MDPFDVSAQLQATEIDENGVDRAQIRAMLALSPVERLKKVEEFVESVLEIRERNGARPVRGLTIRVLSLPALIEAKEQAGRPKDLAVLPVLRPTLDELKRRP
jgi:hypothetical protein